MLTWRGLGLSEGLTGLSGTLNSYDAGKVVQVPETSRIQKERAHRVRPRVCWDRAPDFTGTARRVCGCTPWAHIPARWKLHGASFHEAVEKNMNLNVVHVKADIEFFSARDTIASRAKPRCFNHESLP